MGKRLDITGQRFGKLVAINTTDQRDCRGSVFWKFECDCGNKEVYKVATDVKSGTIVSCGCIRPNALNNGDSRYSSSGKVNLYKVGDKIGRLTINKLLESGNFRDILYECDCDCGGTVDAKHYMLKSGKLNSCGCLHSESCYTNSQKSIIITDITSQKIGKLEAIRCLEDQMKATAIWEYKYDCGNYIDNLKACDFLRERAYSCGCIKSKPEEDMGCLLNDKSVTYKKQYWFRDLVGINGGYLRFDFGILDNAKNLLCLMEFDGYYHFNSNKLEYKGVNVHDITVEHDRLKNEYCENNNIKLFRTSDSNRLEYFIDKVLEEIDYNKNIN